MRIFLTLLGLMLSLPLFAADRDEANIAHTILMQWDTADAPVTVGPVSVVNQHAIAGWTKSDRGGRALLRRTATGWEVFVCGGDDMMRPAYLTQAGMSLTEAQQLLKSQRHLEQQLPQEKQQQLSSFSGVMPVMPQHSHEQHQGHHHHE